MPAGTAPPVRHVVPSSERRSPHDRECCGPVWGRPRPTHPVGRRAVTAPVPPAMPMVLFAQSRPGSTSPSGQFRAIADEVTRPGKFFARGIPPRRFTTRVAPSSRSAYSVELCTRDQSSITLFNTARTCLSRSAPRDSSSTRAMTARNEMKTSSSLDRTASAYRSMASVALRTASIKPSFRRAFDSLRKTRNATAAVRPVVMSVTSPFAATSCQSNEAESFAMESREFAIRERSCTTRSVSEHERGPSPTGAA